LVRLITSLKRKINSTQEHPYPFQDSTTLSTPFVSPRVIR